MGGRLFAPGHYLIKMLVCWEQILMKLNKITTMIFSQEMHFKMQPAKWSRSLSINRANNLNATVGILRGLK